MTTNLGANQKWSFCAASLLVKHLYETSINQSGCFDQIFSFSPSKLIWLIFYLLAVTASTLYYYSSFNKLISSNSNYTQRIKETKRSSFPI